MTVKPSFINLKSDGMTGSETRNEFERPVVAAATPPTRWCGSGSEVKNGTTTRPISRFRHRPPWVTIQ